MQAIYDMFNERVEEINLYFEALKELDSESFQRTENAQHYYNDNFIKILKANTLLMIYNLVESTVMGGILEIYDRVRQEGLTYAGVCSEIKDIWFSYKFRQVYDQQAHYNSYKGKALEIVNSILTGEIIELDRKATDISGNLDAQQIRNVCSEHGIHFRAKEGSHGGTVLGTVKEKRNDLAHGTLSLLNVAETIALMNCGILKSKQYCF